MAGMSRKRAAIKLGFWMLVAAALIGVIVQAFVSGKMAAWYYYRAAGDGFAVNADTFRDATAAAPAVLTIGRFTTIDGPVAVPVQKGDRLPANANGIILTEVIAKGKRAALDGETVRVTVPWEIQQAKGFKFKDTFKHKGVRTWPWAAVWNVVIVFVLGLSLGLMAEGFTDMLGIRLEKIQHHNKPKGSHV